MTKDYDEMQKFVVYTVLYRLNNNNNKIKSTKTDK